MTLSAIFCHDLPVGELGLRQRKKDDTRARLVSTALEYFARDGYAETSVDTIAEAAGISRRSFFRYFPAKQELLFVDAPRRLAEFEALLAPTSSAQSPLDAVRRACLALANEYVSHRHELLVRHRVIESSPQLARRERELDRSFEAAIERAILARYRRPGRPLRRQIAIFAAAIFGATRATLDHWFAQDCKPDLINLASSGLDFFEAGLRLPKPTRNPSRVSKAVTS